MDSAYAPLIAAAEAELVRTVGRAVRLGDAVRLSDEERRNLLLRVHDVAGGAPSSFIIKKIVVDAYDADDLESWDTRRFFSDWSGAAFLSAALDRPRTPRFYGGSYEHGFFILEDLGEHRSLVEPLLEEDAASAEKALLNFAECLGSVHAGTIGKYADLEQRLRNIKPHLAGFGAAASELRHRLEQLHSGLEQLGLRIEPGFSRDVDAVCAAIDAPGPFFAYIHGDPCPDNVFWNGQELRLIDFEFAGFGHALLDGVYPRMMFPTCWCAKRVPAELVSKIERVYRAELAKGCQAARDDRLFESALATACGYWLLMTLSRGLTRALEVDQSWGIATIRQRVFARLEAFLTIAEECGELPALRGMSNRVLDVLPKKWPDTPLLPLYPAFSGT